MKVAAAYLALTPEATAPEPFWCPKCGRSESHDHPTQPEDTRTADPGGLREAWWPRADFDETKSLLADQPEARALRSQQSGAYTTGRKRASSQMNSAEDAQSVADPGGLRAALVRAQRDAQSYYERLQDGTTGKSYHHGRMVAYMDAIEAHDRAAFTPEAIAPDTGSEYGRLLAERDRLISEGVDPADLDSPLPPEATAPDPDR